MLTFPCPPDPHPAIHDLWKWLNDNKLVGFSDSLQISDATSPFKERYFLPTSLLNSYLTNDRITELLQALVGEQHRDLAPQFVRKLRQTCQIVFVILILLDVGPSVRAFVDDNHEWGDRRLPFKPSGDASKFPAGADCFADFCRLQHSFKAAQFDDSLPRTIDRDLILPFKSVNKIGNGFSADVWKAEVHERYTDFPKPGQQRIKHANRQQGTVFVLKRFRPSIYSSDIAEMYEKEVKIFEKISRDSSREPGIIGFHGCFAVTDILDGRKTTLSWNIILDYADQGNLNDFFENIESHQPTNALECWCFWTKFAALFGALSRIHRLVPERAGSGAFQGVHHDIKPSNILVTYDYEHESDPWPFRFMLADFGLATETKMNDGEENTTTEDPDGTKECGAPEAARNPDEHGWTLDVTQKVDVWSLACIMSQALVWCNSGQPKWRRYAQQRGKESKNRIACFHDGFKVLECVQTYHQEALKSIRDKDDFTEKIVHLLTHDMFVPAESRLPSQELRSRARHILDGSIFAKREPLMEPPPPVPPQAEIETTLPSRDRNNSRPSSAPKHQELDNQQPESPNTPGKPPKKNGEAVVIHAERKRHTMSRKTLRAWRTGEERSSIENIGYRERLRGRDIVFIIDDSKTMSSHSAEMELLLRDLAYFIKRCDDNGMELKFMSGAPGCQSKHSSPLVDRLNKRRNLYSIPTEAESFLGKVFHDYAKRWQREQETPLVVNRRASILGRVANRVERTLSEPVEPIKPVSYFIFTDGVWQDNSQVHRPICNLLKRLRDSDEHQVAISFIQFGHDKVGTERLRFLDEDLVKEFGTEYSFDRDVVDSEPENGDVIKMILGPLDSRFDEMGEDSAKQASVESQLCL